MRIAMWSGPRNLSTALMYAFGARSDCAVVDEPFYASYLALTGLQHPMREEILDSQPRDPEAVARALSGPVPGAKPHFYQKHMTQHMIEGVPRDWMRQVTNVFLIRHPARVIASFASKYADVGLEDIGFRQQWELVQQLQAWETPATVIDSHDIRQDPHGKLEALCDTIGLPFSPEMLSWPRGGHRDDGVWAAHWYGAVWNSTGFAGPEGELPEVPEPLQPILKEAMAFYEELQAIKL
ncbi:HAD family hydrolase [Phaeobacter sp. B1627]|uniref:sulfotransferase-like domain-containing protein n=1 Tax=Phaeobacter sp. B1627 TaxID=2583809 RepID=UPI0011187E1D|nr:HAD family hydrolase [Phaeobacter sp. B1627]TNJ45617.1 HAD family hydrolase [Phaeobacter sp. B1627]